MVKQNPATDPVSAAMSAIESALNLTDDDEAVLTDANASPSQLAPAKPTAATPVLKPSQLAGDAPTLLRAGPPPAIAPESEPKPAIPAATPANDDRENVGAVLQAMNARPASRTPFILALVASLLWAAICALYGYVSVWPAAPRDAVIFWPASVSRSLKLPPAVTRSWATLSCAVAMASRTRVPLVTIDSR